MSTLELSRMELKWVRTLRNADVLRPIDEHRLRGNHTISIVCPDCHQIGDIFDHHRRMCGYAPHQLALNGGALLIAQPSPLAQSATEGDVLLENLAEAIRLKNLSRVVLYAHAPCGKAASVNIGVRLTVGLLIAAKRRIKEHEPLRRGAGATLKLFCFVHIAYPESGKKTYFVSRQDWEEFSELTKNMTPEEVFTEFGVR